MVLAAIWEKRNRRRHIAQGFEQGKTVGRDEGREEAHNDWRNWLQHRESAAANGLPFDEPMPTRASIRARNPNPPPSDQP